jgi:chromosomal replication initiation ATPase DnaA
MRVSERLALDEPAARLAASVAGYALGVPPEEIIGDARGSSAVAFARQVAAYLCHTAFEWSLSRVAAAFGRDRSTMAHACHTIEDRRDEPQFDLWIGALETMLREAPPRLQASA